MRMNGDLNLRPNGVGLQVHYRQVPMSGAAGDEIKTSSILEFPVSVNQVFLISAAKYFFSLIQFFPVHFRQAEELGLALRSFTFQISQFLRTAQKPHVPRLQERIAQHGQQRRRK